MTSRESDRLRSLNRRVANAARAQGHDVTRMRRQVAFHRFMARVATTGWVLKGGYCLEVRLPHAARATKDLDLVRVDAVHTEDALLDELDALLDGDPYRDGFVFEAVSARLLRDPDDPATAWRVSITCRVDGREFSSLKVDLVTASAEIAGAVEALEIPSPVMDLGLPSVTVPAVDVYQHAAEKVHAMSRVYAGERPSSRVKDLVDVVLLLDSGLLDDPDAFAARVRAVFAARDAALPPHTLPSLPADWTAPYAHLVTGLPLDDSFTTAAHRVQAYYATALSEGPTS